MKTKINIALFILLSLPLVFLPAQSQQPTNPPPSTGTNGSKWRPPNWPAPKISYENALRGVAWMEGFKAGVQSASAAMTSVLEKQVSENKLDSLTASNEVLVLVQKDFTNNPYFNRTLK